MVSRPHPHQIANVDCDPYEMLNFDPQIKKVRKATREEKKKKAMAMRKKELGALGMKVNEKGQVIAKSALLSEMETQLIEESGLKCCICLEGYKNQPQKVSSCLLECGGEG